MYFEFPTNSTNLSKPLIVEDVNNPGYYFITCSYLDPGTVKNVMYAVYTDTSTPVWELRYDSGEALVPTGLIQSPYNSSELVVVGLNEPNPLSHPTRAIDGFFLKLDVSNGNPVANSFIVYGTSNRQYFTSICEAQSPWGSTGYAVGGVSDVYLGNGMSWMLKLDQSGGIVWNTLITGTSGTNSEITGVLERQNTNGDYQYFGATSSAMSQMTVFRLDHTGTLWSTGGGENEFEYTWGGGGPAYVTKTSPSAASGDGIQVFGTDVSGSSYDTYMVKAYYNGYSGCNESINSIGTQGAGPSSTLSPALSFATVSYTAGEFTIDDNFFGGDFSVVTVSCTGSSVANGDNTRMATGLSEQVEIAGLSVFPLPANKQIHVSAISKTNGPVSVRIYNSAGVCVYSAEKTVAPGENTLHLSVEDLAGGLYSLICDFSNQRVVRSIVISE